MTDHEVITLASAGDEAAWRTLVDKYTPVVWAVARAHRLQGADAADAVQNTWLALAEHLPRLRRPDRVSAWLTTTTRRECLRILLRGRREFPLDTFDIPVTPEPPIFRETRDRLLWQAFAKLPSRCRKLLSLLAHSPELTYVQLSRALGLQVTSIGRTRGRCLNELRHQFTRLGGTPE